MGWGSIGKALSAVNPYTAIATTAADVAGGLYSANKSAKSAKQNTATQINWEREQAQNRIQWAVQDAINAGVNPGVAVGQAPGISGISPSMPDTSGYQQAGNSLNTSLQLMQREKELDVLDKNAETQGFKNIMEGLESGERTKAIPESLKNQTRDSLTSMARQRAEERNMEFQNNLLTQQTIYQETENAIIEVEKEIKTGNFGKALARIDMLLETVKNAGGAASSFIPTVAMWKGAGSIKELSNMITTFKKSNAFKLMNKVNVK